MTSSSEQFLSPSEAAGRLGVSPKALRLYEVQGLVAPVRTAAGWRAYGPDQMRRAAEVVALRGLGLSLAQVSRVLAGDPCGLEAALGAHQVGLEDQLRRLAGTVERIRGVRAELAAGKSPTADELVRLAPGPSEPVATFDLPWPWGGERFELRDPRPLTWIVGPLGSGKTRLARRIAEALRGEFLDLERPAAPPMSALEPNLRRRVEASLAWLAEDGAAPSPEVIALLIHIEADVGTPLVVDMVEQGLDEATQGALASRLRRRGPGARPLYLMTRSCAMLDLAAVGGDEAIIFCPPNHRPPMRVAPWPGAPGYESVAGCLAPSEVRARTEGLVAWRPTAA